MTALDFVLIPTRNVDALCGRRSGGYPGVPPRCRRSIRRRADLRARRASLLRAARDFGVEAVPTVAPGEGVAAGDVDTVGDGEMVA